MRDEPAQADRFSRIHSLLGNKHLRRLHKRRQERRLAHLLVRAGRIDNFIIFYIWLTLIFFMAISSSRMGKVGSTYASIWPQQLDGRVGPHKWRTNGKRSPFGGGVDLIEFAICFISSSLCASSGYSLGSSWRISPQWGASSGFSLGSTWRISPQ